MRVDCRLSSPILELVLVHSRFQRSAREHIYGPCHLASMFLPVLYYCKMGNMCKVHIHEFLNEGEVLDSLAASSA